jgi:hypothetical protein
MAIENLKKAHDSTRVLEFLGFHSLIFDISILAIAKKEKGLKLVEQALAPKTKNSCNFASKQAKQANKQALEKLLLLLLVDSW